MYCSNCLSATNMCRGCLSMMKKNNKGSEAIFFKCPKCESTTTPGLAAEFKVLYSITKNTQQQLMNSYYSKCSSAQNMKVNIPQENNSFSGFR